MKKNQETDPNMLVLKSQTASPKLIKSHKQLAKIVIMSDGVELNSENMLHIFKI
jgi:hypothetical protein